MGIAVTVVVEVAVGVEMELAVGVAVEKLSIPISK